MKPIMNEDLFDDCPVCQMQKKAMEENRPMSEAELRRSLREAEKLGAEVFISPRATKRNGKWSQ